MKRDELNRQQWQDVLTPFLDGSWEIAVYGDPDSVPVFVSEISCVQHHPGGGLSGVSYMTDQFTPRTLRTAFTVLRDTARARGWREERRTETIIGRDVPYLVFVP